MGHQDSISHILIGRGSGKEGQFLGVADVEVTGHWGAITRNSQGRSPH